MKKVKVDYRDGKRYIETTGVSMSIPKRRPQFADDVSWHRYRFAARMACYINKLLRRKWYVVYRHGQISGLKQFIRLDDRISISENGVPKIGLRNIQLVDVIQINGKWVITTSPKDIRRRFQGFMIFYWKGTIPIKLNYLNKFDRFFI